MRILRLLPLLAVVAGVRAADPVRIPWLQDNLVPNPGFEDVDPDRGLPAGWTVPPDSAAVVTTDTTVALEERRSLKLAAPTSPAGATVSSAPIPVEGGARYLCTVAFRQEGFCKPDGKAGWAGAGAYLRGYWLNDKGAQIPGAFTMQFLYGPSPWDLKDSFVEAPAAARAIRIGLTVSNDSAKHTGAAIPSTLWVDAVQFRRYLPPPTPAWATAETARLVEGAPDTSGILSFFPGCENWPAGGGAGSALVPDPDSERGMVLQARANTDVALMAFTGGSSWRLAPGLYRARARVKLPATDSIAALGHLGIGSRTVGARVDLQFLPAPDTADTYTVVEGDFVVWDGGGLGWAVYTNRRQAWTIDSLKIFPLCELTDRELLAIYPGSQGRIPADLKPAAAGSGMKALVVAGLGYERCRFADLIHELDFDTEATSAWAANDARGMTFAGLPEDPAEIFQYAVVFLYNVSLRGLGLKYKNAIHEYVQRGGALVVVGGQQGYERGGWHGSLVEETLPLESAAAWQGGLQFIPRGLPLRLADGLPWLDAIDTTSEPRAYWLHTVALKPTARVLVYAGDKPLLVTGTYGEGRIVCFLAVPWGTPQRGQTPFWQWDDWLELAREVTWWALKRPTE